MSGNELSQLAAIRPAAVPVRATLVVDRWAHARAKDGLARASSRLPVRICYDDQAKGDLYLREVGESEVYELRRGGAEGRVLWTGPISGIGGAIWRAVEALEDRLAG
jgi:hypothetical protein